MHCRSEPLSTPAMWQPTTPSAGRNGVCAAEAKPQRDCRSTRVKEKGQAVPRTLRKRHPTRERGRLARMHCRSDSLRTPAMWQPTTQPAGTACARPKPSRGVIAGRPGWASRPRHYHCKQPVIHGQSHARGAELAFAGLVPPCHVLCGRDARAPGWASRPRHYHCKQPVIHGQSHARGAELAFAGLVPSCHIVCGRDARAPGWASRPRHYHCKQPVIHGQSHARGAELVFAGLVPPCHVLCGRDARAPGWGVPRRRRQHLLRGPPPP